MLQKLYIRNYAIIDELQIHFDQGLNVITGETGAGKSIILGALSLILGDRVDTSVLINRSEKCIVEAVFTTDEHPFINQLLAAEGLDIDAQTIIRREISTTGKSRAFINDTPVNLVTLNEITAHLVDLHRQFDNFALKDRAFVFEVVDAISDNKNLLSTYKIGFTEYKKLEKKLETALFQQQEWQKESDYKQFLFDELDQAGFKENEIEEAELSIRQLSHAEQIKISLANVYQLLESSEPSINSNLKLCLQLLNGISEVFPNSVELAKRLESTLIELKDIAEEADNLEQKTDLNTEHLSNLQERLDLGYRLQKKHQVQSTAELLSILLELQKDLEQNSNSENEILQLKSNLEKLETSLRTQATELHKNRTKHAPIFTAEVNKLLSLIGMPNAELKIEITKKDQLDEMGIDQISILWDANKSGNFQQLQKSASGGELSRIMLCIKTLTAKAMDMPTLIFDEVDTGISGEAARQVGFLLRKLSDSHQVMSITHQPQIAAKGNAHFYVFKVTEKGKIMTKIRQLKEEERVSILAQMIGGDNPTEAAIKNAKELIEEGY